MLSAVSEPVSEPVLLADPPPDDESARVAELVAEAEQRGRQSGRDATFAEARRAFEKTLERKLAAQRAEHEAALKRLEDRHQAELREQRVQVALLTQEILQKGMNDAR